MTVIKLLEAIEHDTLNDFAERLNVSPNMILSNDVSSYITDIRHLYCKLRHEMHKVNYSKIGREIKRTHSAVKFGVSSINGLLFIKDTEIENMWNKVKDIPAYTFETCDNDY